MGRRITVLVIGTDETAARNASGASVHNTDSMLVASINAAHDRIGIVALPRDTVDLPLGDGTIYHGKANSIRWHYGINGLRNALATTYGIPIDFTIEIDMEDFGRLVDAVGGVDVTVYKRIYDAHIRFVLNPGTHHLDGRSATKYVRSRYSAGGDYGRGWRQMQTLMALVRKAAAPSTRVDLLAMARSLGSLKTDIPLDKLATFLEIIRRSQHADVLAQVLQPPHFALFEGIAGARGWVMIPNIPEMRRLVRSIMTG
jgi:polyisoprenyl-teichoic acid--peptidoglycan teichoic acid transferase